MRNVSQFDAGRPGKFRVESQHVDCERHLVDDALAGTVTAGEKLQVAQIVVLPVSVPMMDGLLGVEFAPEVLGHHVAVFKNIARRPAVFARNYQANVSVARYSSSRLLVCVMSLVAQAAKQRSAGGAAQAFLAIDGSSRAPLDGHGVAALDAGDLPCFLGQPAAHQLSQAHSLEADGRFEVGLL